MFKKKHIQKLVFVAILILAVQVLYATNIFSGGRNDKKSESKYSLKNLSCFSNKSLTLSSAKYTYKLKSAALNNNSLLNSSNSSSSIQLTNGNTTFIYPYKMKVKVPKFKTPTSSKF